MYYVLPLQVKDLQNLLHRAYSEVRLYMPWMWMYMQDWTWIDSRKRVLVGGDCRYMGELGRGYVS